MVQVSVSGFGSSRLTITDPTFITGQASKIQLLINDQPTGNPYPGNTGDGLLISYGYVPYQGQTNLPASINIEGSNYGSICVSDLGSGGGITGNPYLAPLQHIPINKKNIINDDIFNNLELMIFSNFNVDSGFVKFNPILNGNLDNIINLSGSTFDNLSRAFYSMSSQELNFSYDGLQISIPRKVFIPIVAKITDKSSSIFQFGEYVMIIFSRGIISEKENVTGYYSNGNSSISVYRLKNRPTIK
jgi:hypothetical protein